MGRASSMEGINRSPSLTPKALTPTNSYDSTASNGGRGSPSVGVASPSSGQEVPVQVNKFLCELNLNSRRKFHCFKKQISIFLALFL